MNRIAENLKSQSLMDFVHQEAARLTISSMPAVPWILPWKKSDTAVAMLGCFCEWWRVY